MLFFKSRNTPIIMSPESMHDVILVINVIINGLLSRVLLSETKLIFINNIVYINQFYHMIVHKPFKDLGET